MKKVFDTHGGDTKLNDRTGQVVDVLRPLTEAEADIADVGKMYKVRFPDGFETDAFEDELSDLDDKMVNIREALLPGFYTDERGAYGIVLGSVYICCFINSDDGQYDVTVDTVGESGDFDLNLEWDSFDEPQKAVKRLRHFVKKYVPKRGRC